MAVLTTPCPALFPKPPQAFPDRLALANPVPLACFGPLGGQAEHVTWTHAPCRSLSAGRPLARHQRRLLRMHGAVATGEAFRPDGQHPAGLGFALTADATIIGTASQKTVALPPGADVLATPFVQDMRQEYLGAQGRTAPAWRCPLVGGPQRSRLPHARVPPRATSSPSASSTAPLRDTLPQRAPGQVVDPSTALRIDSPMDGPRPTRLPPRVPRVLGPMARPAARGAGMEILRDERRQAHPHHPLDALVRAAGLP